MNSVLATTLNRLRIPLGPARRLKRDDRGQDLIEYALLMAFMVIAVYVILPNDLMPTISGIFSRLISTADKMTAH